MIIHVQFKETRYQDLKRVKTLPHNWRPSALVTNPLLAFIRALSRSLQMARLHTNSSHQVLLDSNYKSPAVLAGELSDGYNATTPPSPTPRSTAYLRSGFEISGSIN
ncbi:hypothetical protein CEXT_758241 [Caerostris extrusa]|uniref:Uncharacterized protein n=1 Tax=Caerostris extrusa TaxID=172846 RepID=A0AAV4PZ58_CAEEX|nr:hypothetical protein CEXT_758241 [Caerostris extrusa]